MIKSFAPATALLISACGGAGVDESASARLPIMSSDWEAGPTIAGFGNYSAGTAINQTAGGVAIDIPPAPQSTHYLSRRMSLAGKRRICMSYRFEGALAPVTAPSGPSMLSLYFQRAGDDWSGKGRFEAYRWYSPEIDMPITPGQHRICAGLDENWTAVETSSAAKTPTAFHAAKEDTVSVGFVLGGGTGRGHGVYAVGGRARIVVTAFEID